MDKFIETGTEIRWLPPAIIFISAFCLFFAGSRLNSSARAEAELQTGEKSRILVTLVQLEGGSYELLI